VICAGGGGIPVVPTAAGHLCGVEAVVDKDLAAARLAMELDADAPAAAHRRRRRLHGVGHPDNAPPA
jgi:carbamate kinase